MAASPCAILIVTASVGASSGRVYEAMGYGALDAVDTPDAADAAGARALLTKIDTIGKLIRDRGSARTAGATGARGAAPQPGAPQLPLIAIGASAGGPAALVEVLSGLPRELPAAVVIVQHVDALFAAGMAQWLGRHSVMPVRLAREGDAPAPGVVLLAGSNDHLYLRPDQRLGYTAEPRNEVYRPSVDVFFRSLCQRWSGEAIGVLLTGMGRDGAAGLKALRDKGWHTIAQDRASSAVFGMPKAAIALGAAVEVLPLSGIARHLRAKLERQKSVAPGLRGPDVRGQEV